MPKPLPAVDDSVPRAMLECVADPLVVPLMDEMSVCIVSGRDIVVELTEQTLIMAGRPSGTDITFTTAALGLRACSPIASGMSGAISYNFSDVMSKERPKNVPGNGSEGA